MGILLSIPEKQVVSKYNESWAVNIQGAKNANSLLFTDPIITIHFRETTKYSDGTNFGTNDPLLTTPEFIPRHTFTMSSAVMRTGDMEYMDKTGTLKTIPLSDIPLIVRSYLDFIGTEVRMEKAAQLQQMIADEEEVEEEVEEVSD
jgi:hypothetical protein